MVTVTAATYAASTWVGANAANLTIPLDATQALAPATAKADDVIAVGSYWAAPFLAVWRNAFRMTYGFGFIYDRNYSSTDFEIPFIAPSSGTRFQRH